MFLFDSMPRTDEVEFLQRLGFTPLNTLGVLSRADGFGRGVLGNRDPLGHAAEHANVLARRLAGQVGTVVPVAGLLAQTSHTGAFTDADARALAALDHWPRWRCRSARHGSGRRCRCHATRCGDCWS